MWIWARRRSGSERAVDDLVVSRAGHLALRLNPQDWHREANLIEDIPVRLRVRRKRQDPRTEETAPINCDSFDQFTLSFRSKCAEILQIVSEKMSINCHITMNTHVIVLSALFLLIDVVLHVLIQFATIAPTRPFVQGVFFNVDDKNSCSNASSSLVESDCVSAEVNIVEEEQSMWRRIKKGTKFQLDAGRRSALLLSSQQVKNPLCC